MQVPKISCIMPTYNRLRRRNGQLVSDLLDEAVECFLRQDYPNRELIILNDTPGQTLVYEDTVPEGVSIQIINIPERMTTLGIKCNYGIQRATGVFITRWDDDDISLPNRLSLAANRIDDHGLLIVQGWFYEEARGRLIADIGPIGFATDLARRELALKAPYTATKRCNEDQLFRSGLQSAAESYEVFQPNLEELHYIYRWGGTGHAHFSAHSDESAYDKFESGVVATGTYQIRPRWRRDYVAYTEAARAAIAGGAPVYEDPAADESTDTYPGYR